MLKFERVLEILEFTSNVVEVGEDGFTEREFVIFFPFQFEDFLFFVICEVAAVEVVLEHVSDEGRFQLLGKHLRHVDFSEPRVVQDVSNLFEAKVGVLFEHAMQKFLEVFGDFNSLREFQVFGEDVVEEFALIARVVGRQSE